MELTTQQYTLIANTNEEFALRNKSKDKNSVLLIVSSTTQPAYTDAVNENAFEIGYKETLTSNDLPTPIWGAPLNKSVRFSLQKWS